MLMCRLPFILWGSYFNHERRWVVHVLSFSQHLRLIANLEKHFGGIFAHIINYQLMVSRSFRHILLPIELFVLRPWRSKQSGTRITSCPLRLIIQKPNTHLGWQVIMILLNCQPILHLLLLVFFIKLNGRHDLGSAMPEYMGWLLAIVLCIEVLRLVYLCSLIILLVKNLLPL